MDVGRLERGLPVNISLDGFDALIYGKPEGQQIYLSSDTLTEKAGGWIGINLLLCPCPGKS